MQQPDLRRAVTSWTAAALLGAVWAVLPFTSGQAPTEVDGTGQHGVVLFAPPVPAGSGLVTNEWAYFTTDGPAARSPDWEMTSGSLFHGNGTLWTGIPDAVQPDARSADGTGSAVFRLTTRRHDFGDVTVTLQLVNAALSSTPATPAQDWDGVHVFLHYQDEASLYYASVNRRDGKVVAKKKCRGGPDNGGTYYELGDGEQGGHPIPFGRWQSISASVLDERDGAVRIVVSLGGHRTLDVTDTGVGCLPIRRPGAVGLRGDNDSFRFRAFVVRSA